MTERNGDGVVTCAIEGLDPALHCPVFGDKAVLLKRAIDLGLPVPAGFAVTREGARAMGRGEADEALEAVLVALAQVEGLAPDAWVRGQLVVSVRASTDQASPGVQPSILDVGACGEALGVLEARLGGRDAALDARARFLRGLGRAQGRAVRAQAVRGTRLAAPSAAELEREITELEAQLGLAGATAHTELRAAIAAVASHDVPVLLQAMRFGSARGGPSGAGTASSRHPITGEPVIFGEIAWQRQGEDVSLGRGAGVSLRRAAAGRRAEESLEAQAPELLASLEELLARAEQALDAVVDLEITVEQGALWVLQLRETVLTPRAEVRTLVDRAGEGAISVDDALRRVRLESVAKVGRVELVAEQELPPGTVVLGRGLGASPGAASGRVAIEVEDAVRRAAAGERVVLVRSDASPEDAPAVRAALAVATASGGLTSHAAVMSRALGRPCAVSVSNLRVNGDEVWVESRGGREALLAGDLVTVDGTRGLLVRGIAPIRWTVDDEAPRHLAAWARGRAAVRVLVDDAGGDADRRAQALEADGVATADTPRWEGPAQAFPRAESVAVAPGLVATARVAAAKQALAAG